MRFSRLWAYDGNTSLKRMLPFGNRVAADERLYNDNDYFLPRSFVDRFADEGRSKKGVAKPPPHPPLQSNSDDSEAKGDDKDISPVSGVDTSSSDGVGECVAHWKAAAADSQKKSWAVFDETGIYAAVCQHSLVLWICDMVRSGEL